VNKSSLVVETYGKKGFGWDSMRKRRGIERERWRRLMMNCRILK